MSDPKTIYNAWSMINSIVSLPVANIFAGEVIYINYVNFFFECEYIF